MSALSLLFFIKDVFLIEFLIYNTECFTTEILLNISYCFGKSALISEILLEFFQSRFDVTALIRDLSVQSAARTTQTYAREFCNQNLLQEINSFHT